MFWPWHIWRIWRIWINMGLELLNNILMTTISGWWFGTFGLFFPFSWECHNANWLSYFFIGVGQPPTRYIYIYCIYIPGYEMGLARRVQWPQNSQDMFTLSSEAMCFPCVFLLRRPYKWDMSVVLLILDMFWQGQKTCSVITYPMNISWTIPMICSILVDKTTLKHLTKSIFSMANSSDDSPAFKVTMSLSQTWRFRRSS